MLFLPRGRRGLAHRSSLAVGALAGALALVAVPGPPRAQAADPCAAPVTSPVACENTRPGSPASEWDVDGAGSPSIQGYATDISVDVGQTARFKVDTSARSFRVDVYRLGYYSGAGARKVATVVPTSVRRQPACLTEASTGLVDCGNWSESATWQVPADAVSGVYVAKLVRTDRTAGASHVVFVVRDDASRSALLLQTSDTTWQAYNRYGGNSLYTGSPAGRAYKVSYNRPFTTRGTNHEDWLFNAEYPMIRWLERNGYDVSYTTGVDSDRRGALIGQHAAFLSVGHDEYWSGAQRAHVEAARDAGTHLAFFSGNEVFWKTRWEPATDGSGTPHRTLVSYKETLANAKIDPEPGVWTGTWRDPRFSPPADGGRPENALTGTSFKVNCCATDMFAQASAKDLRFWRNTRVATLPAGASTRLGTHTLGYEWDEDPDNGHRPPGLVPLSSTTVPDMQVLTDHGSSYSSGTATHSLTLHRAPSGALVFGSGTVQWSWGLDGTHDAGSSTPDEAMQQATVNLLADMGSQPATPQPGLVLATATTDATAPTAVISAPADGSAVPAGATVTISGTASDTGGVVGVVEVSTDGGSTWRRATGRSSWTYAWRVPSGSGEARLLARAGDDSANTGPAGPAVTVAVGGTAPPAACPCSLWGEQVEPAILADPDTSAVELGTRFTTARDGVVSGVRFYKSGANTGTHIGRLWTAAGEQLAQVTFTGESSSGWQQAAFDEPVPVTAGSTYVVSYLAPAGRYSTEPGLFASSGLTSGPLTAPRDGQQGPNGVYRYGAGGGFPSDTWNSAAYFVDVVFEDSPTDPPPDVTPPTVTTHVPAEGAGDVGTSIHPSATFSEPVTGATVSLVTAAGASVPGSTSYDEATRRVSFAPSAALQASTTYSVEVDGAVDRAGHRMTAVTWSFTTAAAPTPVACPCSLWDPDARPAVEADPDRTAVELGVRFRTDVPGQVTGIRFYKSSDNAGTHLGRLWTSGGQLLSTATFTDETASGWQQVSFAEPVPVVAGTTYVASYYAPVGRYATDEGYFGVSGRRSGPLEALRDGADGGNGAYRYGTGGGFPTSTWRSTNYWVDVVFDTASG